MGQYYTIVNLDKKEFLSPHDFNEGAKLMEWSQSEGGVNPALAVLLSNGNGKGGGDAYQYTCMMREEFDHLRRGVKETYPKYKERMDKMGLRIESKSVTRIGKKETCYTLVPKVSGRWAGDRIVVAGDYGDKGKFLPDRALNKKELAGVKKAYTDPSKYKRTSDFNLNFFADMNFKDISKETIRQMKNIGENI